MNQHARGGVSTEEVDGAITALPSLHVQKPCRAKTLRVQTGQRGRAGRAGSGEQVSRPRLRSPSPTFGLLMCSVEITGKLKRGKVCLSVESNTRQIANSQYISVIITNFLCKTSHKKSHC